ncbi:hypothetical protein [Staphylococcus ureilyticus]|uniref:hypothetical protein n=1 Tax=Staphylococcus ureilyticus TaxID=94138 RepID=UPI0021D1ADCE|nr:hypothetical protein [Staphylococcus ureilyticus]UXS61027.1 hypothetical protein MUA21_05370 [Staphylococcus ureilyticus]
MIPPMRQSITISIPLIDDNGNEIYNDYGKPLTDTSTFKCRVNEHAELQRSKTFVYDDAVDEVDVMHDVPIETGVEVEYTTRRGTVKKGTVKSYTETTNLSASRTYFRTLIINGK